MVALIPLALQYKIWANLRKKVLLKLANTELNLFKNIKMYKTQDHSFIKQNIQKSDDKPIVLPDTKHSLQFSKQT